MARPLNDLAQLRAAEERVSELARAELAAFARRVDWSKTAAESAALSDLFQVAVVKIVERHALAAASLAADFYDECRAAAGAPGAFRARAQPAPPAEGVRAQVRFAARWLFGSDPQPGRMLDFLAGEVDKKVKQAFRDTIAVSASLDPAKPRLRRVTAGTCEFCEKVADRDWDMAKRGHHRSQVNAYHPNCRCVPVAVWAAGTGTLAGRFSGLVGKLLGNARSGSELVQAAAAQTVARANQASFADIAGYMAPKKKRYLYFTNEERLAAARLEDRLGIRVRSVDHRKRNMDLQRAGGREAGSPMRTPDAVIEGRGIPVEIKSLDRVDRGSKTPAAKVAQRVVDASEQARVAVIDGTESGITGAQAREGIRAAVGKVGEDLDMVVVMLGRETTIWGL